MARNDFSSLAKQGELTAIPLAGLQGVGANMHLVMTKDADGRAHGVIIDNGVTYNYSGTLPVDVAMFDPRALDADSGLTIHAVVQTHGHEDHIGAAPFNAHMGWLRDVPVYGPALSKLYTERNLARAKFDGQELDAGDWPETRTFMPGDDLQFGPLRIDSCAVEHSMAHSTMIRVRPKGAGDSVVFSGDLRLDSQARIGWETDFPTLHRWGDEGVGLMFMESTNALGSRSPGTYADAHAALDRLVKQEQGSELWIPGLARNSSMLGNVVDVAARNDKTLVFNGGSMRELEELYKIAGLDIRNAASGKLKTCNTYEARNLIAAGKLDPADCLHYMTGPLGGKGVLPMIASGEWTHLQLRPGVVVAPLQGGIPGTEQQSKALDAIIRDQGARIIRPSKDLMLSVSGHYQIGEAPEFVVPLRPKAVAPNHGGPAQRKALAATLNQPQVAREIGHDVVVLPAENGSVIAVKPSGTPALTGGQVPVSFVGFNEDDEFGFQAKPVYGLKPELFGDKKPAPTSRKNSKPVLEPQPPI